VTGSVRRAPTHTRQRSQSEPVVPDYKFEADDDLLVEGESKWTPSLSPTGENNIPSPPHVLSDTSSMLTLPISNVTEPYNRIRAMSSPHVLETSRKKVSDKAQSTSKKPVSSILDQMLSQHDINGAGISKAVATELSILLYMILDAGNAWTSMALNLLALDESALKQVEGELNHLTVLHGKDGLFTSQVMGQMRYLDALIWESIRLCPPFLGGMKVLSETIEFPDDGVQIPKNANVIFCHPTERNFDLSEAWGKMPQKLAFSHPCPEM
jgi:Cytochrome P450